MRKRRLGILGFGLGSGILVLIAGAVFLPRFLDVDRYRPWLVDQVNRSIRGKFELGRLELTLWGRLAVRAGGAQLKTAGGDTVVLVPEIEIAWPWSSVFSGKPELSLRLKSPEIFLTRKKGGQTGVWNFSDLIQAEVAPDVAPSPAPAANGAIAVPALVLKSKLGVEITGARIKLDDAVTATVLQLPNLDLRLKDVSLLHPFQWELGSRVQYSAAEGVFQASGSLAPEFQSGELKNLVFSADLDATGLALRPTSGVIKGPKQPLLVAVRGSWSPAAIQIQSLNLTAGSWTVSAQGRVDAAPVDRIAMTLSAKDLSLAQLNEWMSALPPLAGQITTDVVVSGSPAAVQIQADLKGKALQAALPQFGKEKPEMDFAARATLDRVDIQQARLRLGPGAKDTLNVTGSVSGLRKMPELLRGELKIQAERVDLDRLGLTGSDPKTQGRSTAKAKASVQVGAASAAGGRANDKDESVNAQWMKFVRSPWMQKAEFALVVGIQELIANGVTLTDMKAKALSQRGRLELNDLGFQVFEGKVRSRVGLATQGSRPLLSFGGQVENLNLKKAAESQWALFKNTLEGRLELKWDATSNTLETAELLRALEMKGGFRVLGARFASIDLSKILVEKINQSIDRAADQVPALRSKRLQNLPDKAAFYESVASDFVLAEGRLRSQMFLAKPQAGAGLEIAGPYEVDVIDQKWSANWMVSDPYNVTHAADLSVNIAGTEVPHILIEPGSPLKIPLQMGCVITEPCVSNDKIVEHFARVAGGNVGRAAAKAAGEQIKRLIPSDVIKKFW